MWSVYDVFLYSDPMSNTIGIYIHNLSSWLYSYAQYTYAAGYIFNLMLKPYLRHMQMCNDNLVIACIC